MTTVRELAKLAGVSRSTVSRALTNTPRINPATRARILELAAQFDYRPPHGMPASSVLTIGCLIPHITSPFWAKILSGVLHAAFAESCHVITLETYSLFERTRLALSALVAQRVAGVLLGTGHAQPIPQEDLLRLWGAGVVPVCLDTPRATVPLDTVQTDWPRYAEIVVNHFVSLGHRHILAYAPSSVPVTQAIRRRLQVLGFPVPMHDDAWLSLPFGHQLQRIMAMQPRPTALFIGFDAAVWLAEEAARCGIKIPDDLSVVTTACNVSPPMDIFTQSVGTMEQFPEEIGKRAFELLSRRLAEGCPRPAVPEIITIPPRLIVRATSAPPSR
ncbi:MAG: LacI family DNA-binding transcriptional regulator [Armatimonadota bacterium]